jgi:hypothetical protein
MANPTTYFGWVMPTSSSLVTNLPADFNTFGQGVDTSLQDLLGGTTGQVLSKTSGTNMDFTWVTPTDQTPLTTKGDLFTFSTVDARLGVGTNGQTLVADSTASTGLKWATPSSGAMTLIQRSTFSNVANTSTTFDGVFTSSYKSYQIVIESFYAATGSDDLNFQWRIAGVTEAAAYYGNTIQYVFSGSTITNTAFSATSLVFLNTACGTSANPGAGTLSVYGCSGSSNTSQIIASYTESATANSANTYYINTSASIRTGFILKSSSSNITGTVAVYGLA